MHDYSLSPACFKMLLYVPGARSSDGTIGLDQLDRVANLGHKFILS